MKASVLALLLPASGTVARFIERRETDQVQLNAVTEPKYLVELGPDETRWVTEEEKWELRRNNKRFFDITEQANENDKAVRANHASSHAGMYVDVAYPAHPQQQKEVKGLLTSLNKSEIHENLKHFTSFWTRYYKSDSGRQSSEWLLGKVRDMIKAAGADATVKAEHFAHPWGQNSVIATIPGKTNSTIVVGAHQDSINLFMPALMAAPGADDDGSGSMTILEAFRVLLSSPDVVQGRHKNTIEFHWYSAEEGGLLGSQAIFKQYQRQGRDVKAMLQQDMTGFVQKTLDAGKPESVGVIVDYVNPGLTVFIKKIIEEYCDIPWVETKCGYACSDHASASKAGYPSAFVIESAFEYSDNHIHTTEDKIEYLSFDHMLQHAKMTTAFAYELAKADFPALALARGREGL